MFNLHIIQVEYRIDTALYTDYNVYMFQVGWYKRVLHWFQPPDMFWKLWVLEFCTNIKQLTLIFPCIKYLLGDDWLVQKQIFVKTIWASKLAMKMEIHRTFERLVLLLLSCVLWTVCTKEIPLFGFHHNKRLSSSFQCKYSMVGCSQLIPVVTSFVLHQLVKAR